jgi:negative regulator of flagellin synthesis FlgM
MINSIGTTGTSGTGLVGTTTTQTSPLQTDALGRTKSTHSGTSVSTTISRLAAEGAPIDTDRISALRAAIKAGTYRADPKAIASAMVDSDFGATL